MDSPSPSRSGGSSDPVAEAKAKASALKDDVKDKAAGLADQAQTEAKERVDAGKQKAAGALENVADALHDTGDALRENDQDAFARYADNAADQLDQFVDGIRDRSVGELFDEAERFARQDPGLFVGGAFLLGIFGARFLKASASDAGRSHEGPAHDRASPSMQRSARGASPYSQPRPASSSV